MCDWHKRRRSDVMLPLHFVQCLPDPFFDITKVDNSGDPFHSEDRVADRRE